MLSEVNNFLSKFLLHSHHFATDFLKSSYLRSERISRICWASYIKCSESFFKKVRVDGKLLTWSQNSLANKLRFIKPFLIFKKPLLNFLKSYQII